MSTVTDTGVLTGRYLAHLRRQPGQLAITVAFPLFNRTLAINETAAHLIVLDQDRQLTSTTINGVVYYAVRLALRPS